ncbi:MAG: AraC family transcriptional regulator [Treponema sp.]|jgi:AraC-like DNA-binding protein|nr:AraC family transcriptional regulator [Treponema sp.]
MKVFLSDSKYPLVHISSGKLETDKSFIHQKRNLDTFVFIVCLRGTLFIGQDKHEYVLKENQYILLFTGYDHFGYKESPVSYFWCHFKVTDNKYHIIRNEELSHFLNISPPDKAGAERKIINDEHFSQYYIIPEHGDLSANGRTILIFRQLLDVARKNCFSSRLPNYALSLLAMEISQEFLESYMHKNKKGLNPKMERIIEWIRINFTRHLNIEKIAKIFHYNPDYLSTIFRKYTGVPLMKYICMIRISHAKKLLIDTNYGIKEIAFQCGFDDEKAFMKRFKQIEDITPTTYRNAFPRTKMVKPN